MKNITKLIIVLLLLITMGCPDNNSPVMPREEFYFVINNIEIQNIDNSGRNPVIIENENVTIPKEGYGIRIIFNLEQLTDSVINDAIINNGSIKNFTKNITLSTNLYATSCDDYSPPLLTFKDTILNIKIFSLNDFDNENLANSDVSNLFRIYDSNKYISIEEYLEKHTTIYFEGYYNPYNMGRKIDLYLMKAPVFTGEHSFSIEVLLSDGRILYATTSIINLE